MKRFLRSVLYFIVGGMVVYIFLVKNNQKNKELHSEVVIQQIKSLKNLIVTEGVFSETFSYQDSKNYFYDLLQFEKKAIVIVNAKVQVSYNLGLLETEIDSEKKIIYLKKIPEPELQIIPNIRYFDMQQSSFNNFSSADLNTLQQEAIKRIAKTSEAANIKERAKKDLIEELKKVYVLTNVLKWTIVDETTLHLDTYFKD